MSDDAQAILHAKELVAAYTPTQTVLQGLDIALHRRELVCILGQNGSGKSTLLRCLLGLLKFKTGEVTIQGTSLRVMSPKQVATAVAYVPQRSESTFAFTVREVVLTGRYAHGGLLGFADGSDVAAAEQAMEQCGISSLGGRLFGELSGGEAQCVMIARALAQRTKIMLLDEPTSHLDLKNQTQIYQMMRSLAHEHELGVMCVSHDVNLAARFADRLVMMHGGVVVADGKPADVLTEANLEATYDTKVDLLNVERLTLPLVIARDSDI